MKRKFSTAPAALEAGYVVDASGCWLWTKETTSIGYGRVRFNGVRYGAHRLAYETYVGPIPEGMEIDHLCRVRNCVNPDHLEAVTHRENMLRGDTTARAHQPISSLLHHDILGVFALELRKAGLLVDSGKTRPTRTGSQAIVWRLS